MENKNAYIENEARIRSHKEKLELLLARVHCANVILNEVQALEEKMEIEEGK